MKRLIKFLAVLGALLNIQLSAQIAIGQYTLARIAAPALQASIGAGGFTRGFLASVGGVAFKETAHPAPGLPAQAIVLEYAPEFPDGQRVFATIDGQRVQVNLYDWQLRPIVQFAQSKEHAVFTLFGKLADEGQQAEIMHNGGRVVNYHPAFENTLLGLRMLQVDNLLADSEGNDLAVELPREHNRYLLGPGEASPNVAGNRTALASFKRELAEGLGRDAQDFRSYVVGDTGQDVRFDVEQGSLRISGEPGYYFWRYKGDDIASEEAILKGVRARVRQTELAARKAQGPAFDERSWLVGQIVKTLQQINGRPLDAKAAAEYRSLDVDRLRDELEDARVEQAEMQVEPRTQLSRFVNAHITMVRSINPIAWDAATTVMRYAAFFRFCRENNQSAWQEFAKQVNAIQVQPSVITPTVLQLASAKQGADRSRVRR